MRRSTLIRGARQLLTLHGPTGPRRGADLRNLGIIQDGAVLIVDGLIREVGSTRRLENLAEARKAEEIDATGRVVLPGLVDCSTHLVAGPPRLSDFEMRLAGATNDQIVDAGGGWQGIYRVMQDVPVRSLETQAWRALRECIRHGTTTLESKSGYGVSETGEIKILRTHAALNQRIDSVISTFMVSRQIPGDLWQTREEYVSWLVNRLLPVIRRRKLAQFVDVPIGQDTFDLAQARQILQAARQLGFATKVHAGEFWNIGGVQLAIDVGAVTIDHAVHLDHDDMAALSMSNTMATLLPGPVFYLGTKRYPNARALIDRGVAVALATGFNPESCPSHNMQLIIALACRKMEMTPAEAVSAATINGAHALRRADTVGSIEFGKHADLLMLSVSDYREIPYHFGINLVDTVLKRGEVIYQASQVQCPPKLPTPL